MKPPMEKNDLRHVFQRVPSGSALAFTVTQEGEDHKVQATMTSQGASGRQIQKNFPPAEVEERTNLVNLRRPGVYQLVVLATFSGSRGDIVRCSFVVRNPAGRDLESWDTVLRPAAPNDVCKCVVTTRVI